MRMRLAILATACLATAAHATVLTPPVHLTAIQTLTDYVTTGADVVFEVNATVTGCYGFWLSPADPGSKQAYASLLTAKAMDAAVVIQAYDNQVWGGSASFNYCRVRSLTIQ